MTDETIHTASADASMHIEDRHSSLMTHLSELRVRLLWSFAAMTLSMIIAFIFVEEIYGFLVKPLADAMGGNGTNRLIYTGLTEAFFTYLKISFFAGLFISFPVIALQIWKFVAPGLYKNEKGAFLPFLLATPILFFAGGACVYYMVMPLAWPFFLSFQSSATETTLPIQLEARVGEYLDLVMVLIFAFGLCFQLPVLLTLLGRAGIISSKSLATKRKYAILIAFVVAAFLTPPDIISQAMLALPIMVLYEVSIILVKHYERRSKNAATDI